jgi:hypothetical protein
MRTVPSEEKNGVEQLVPACYTGKYKTSSSAPTKNQVKKCWSPEGRCLPAPTYNPLAPHHNAGGLNRRAPCELWVYAGDPQRPFQIDLEETSDAYQERFEQAVRGGQIVPKNIYCYPGKVPTPSTPKDQSAEYFSNNCIGEIQVQACDVLPDSSKPFVQGTGPQGQSLTFIHPS